MTQRHPFHGSAHADRESVAASARIHGLLSPGEEEARIAEIGGRGMPTRGRPGLRPKRMDVGGALRVSGDRQTGFAIDDRLEDVQAELEALHQAFDALATAIVTVTSTGRVRSVNRLAARILAARDGLQLEGERLRASFPQDQPDLDDLLSVAADPSSGERMTKSEIRLRRAAGARPLVVSLTAVRRPPARNGPADAEATVVLRLGDTGLPSVSPTEFMTQRFGLTRAEAELLDRLVLGRSLREVAAEGGVSYETVRSRIKQVFSKTGTHRQIDLVNLARSLSS